MDNQRLPDLPGGLKWGREGFKAWVFFWVLLGLRVKLGGTAGEGGGPII